jgi:hypothetical protein
VVIRTNAVLAVTLVGCHTDPLSFSCSSDTQCGSDGICTQNRCAFPSSDCPSGYRFDESAETLAGQCVNGNAGVLLDMSSYDLAGGDFADLDLSITDLSMPSNLSGSQADMLSPTDLARTGAPIWTVETPTGVWTDVYAKSRTDAWICGYGGFILHSPGDGTWSTPLTTGTTQNLRTIWGDRSTGDIWAGGDNNTLIRSSNGGATWIQESLSQNIGAYTMQASGSNVNAITGAGPSNLYAAFYNSGIYSSNGSGNWTSVYSLSGSFSNGDAADPYSIYFVDNNRVVRGH